MKFLKFLKNLRWQFRVRIITDFKGSYNVKCFKEIKHLKSLQKAERYLKTKQVSMIEGFGEYT